MSLLEEEEGGGKKTIIGSLCSEVTAPALHLHPEEKWPEIRDWICQNSFRQSRNANTHTLKCTKLDFSGGPVVENPPASAGGTGSVFGLGRAHIYYGATKPRVPQQLSPCATTTEVTCSRACAPRQEKPPQ